MRGLVKIHWVEKSADNRLDLARRISKFEAKLALQQLKDLKKSGEMPLRDFLVRHADEFGIVPRRYSRDPASAQDGFQHDKPFGSYVFEAKYWDDTFELSNARKTFTFRYDMKTHMFILGGRCDLHYNVVKTFTESKYNYNLRKSVSQPIACWDKFIKWWHAVVDAYLDEINN